MTENISNLSDILENIYQSSQYCVSGLFQTSTIICGLLTIALIIYLKRKYFTNKLHGHQLPPGPSPWPIIGDLARLGRRPHLTLTSWRERYGDVYRIQMGAWPTVVLNGIDVIKHAMVKQSEDFAGRPDFYTFSLLADGKSMGFANYSPRWRMHRRIAQNALGNAMTNRQGLHCFIQEEAAFLANILAEISQNKGAVNPHDEIFKSVGSIICCLCFGKKYERDDPDFLRLIQMNADFMAYVGAGNPVDVLPWMRHFTQRSFKNFMKILNTMEEFVMTRRREHFESYDSSLVRDILDFLIKSTKEIPEVEKQQVGLTDEHILVTVQEMIGAGFDTIATTLQWSLLYMAMNPGFQEKARNEILKVIPKDKAPEVYDVEDLPYIEACILEIMRLSCIFPLALPHSTTRNTVLNGYIIPENTLVFVNLWSVTRDESLFPDPETFLPERFLTVDGNNQGRVTINKAIAESILPFGAGKRRCPGEVLAKAEIFLFLVTLLQNYTIEAYPGQAYTLDSKYGLTLKPQDHKLVIKRLE